MSIFIAIYNKNNDENAFSPDMFTDFLPFEQETVLVKKISRVCLIVWQWGSVLDNPPIDLGGACMFAQGIVSPAEIKKFSNLFKTIGDFKPTEINKSCVLMYFNGLDLTCKVGLGCGEVAFWVETDNYILISNKIGLFSPFLSFIVRKKAIMQYAGRMHVIDDGTLFEGIHRLSGGYTLTIRNNKRHINLPNLAGCFSPIGLKESLEYIDNNILSYSGVGLGARQRLSLSGGKDSRGILSYLERFGYVNEKLEVTTVGEIYSPEVMSAKKVIKLYNEFKPNHTIRTRNSVFYAQDIVRDVVRSLFNSDGNISLADFCGIAKNNTVVWGGHENGLKSVNTKFKDIDCYVKSQAKMLNSANFLNDDAFLKIKNIYYTKLLELMDGIPPEAYFVVDPLFTRNSIWVASTIMCQNFAAATIHPYLDFSITRAVGATQKEITSCQLFHFYIQNKSQFPLVEQPFCNDRWPGGLFPLLDHLNIKYSKKAECVIPYKFFECFPEEKRFGFFSQRQFLLKLFRPWMLNVIQNNTDYFSFLNEDIFYDCMRKDENDLTFQEMYRILAILTCCFFIRFGKDILCRSKAASIVESISEELDHSFSKVAVQKKEKTIEDYENALAFFVEREHELASLRFVRPIRLTSSWFSQEYDLNGQQKIILKIYFSKSSDDTHSSALFNVLCDDSDIPLEGFSLSAKGFHFKYIVENIAPGLCVTELSLPKGINKLTVRYKLWNAKDDFYLLGTNVELE